MMSKVHGISNGKTLTLEPSLDKYYFKQLDPHVGHTMTQLAIHNTNFVIDAMLDSGATISICNTIAYNKFTEFRQVRTNGFEVRGFNGKASVLRDYLLFLVINTQTGKYIYVRFYHVPGTHYNFLLSNWDISRLGLSFAYKIGGDGKATQGVKFHQCTSKIAKPNNIANNINNKLGDTAECHQVIYTLQECIDEFEGIKCYAHPGQPEWVLNDYELDEIFADQIDYGMAPQYVQSIDLDKFESMLRSNENGIIPLHINFYDSKSWQRPGVMNRFVEICKDFQDIFAAKVMDINTRIKGITAKFNLKPNAILPLPAKMYPMSKQNEAIVHEKVDELLAAGMIEPGTGDEKVVCRPFIVNPDLKIAGNKNTFQRAHDDSLIRSEETKRTSKARMVIDQRPANNIDTPQPCPTIDKLNYETLLSNAKYLLTTDVKSGFHQIEIEPESRVYFGFVTPRGIFRWTVMNFGWINAPSTWNRAMYMIFGNIKFVIYYMDDILGASDSIEAHFKLMIEIFKACRKFKLKLNIFKSRFFMTSVVHVGKEIDLKLGHRLGPTIVKRVQSFFKPNNMKQLITFMGMATYTTDQIPKLAELLYPLRQISKIKNTPFYILWDKKCDDAFNKIRNLIIENKWLANIDFENGGLFILRTDASEYAMGYVLEQIQDNVPKIVSVGSKAFNPSQANWGIWEKEICAIVTGVEHYRKYLISELFICITDHRNLMNLLNLQKNMKSNGKFYRYSIRLSPFRFIALYLKGDYNPTADFFSRLTAHFNFKGDQLPRYESYKPVASKGKFGTHNGKPRLEISHDTTTCDMINIAYTSGDSSIFMHIDSGMYDDISNKLRYNNMYRNQIMCISDNTFKYENNIACDSNEMINIITPFVKHGIQVSKQYIMEIASMKQGINDLNSYSVDKHQKLIVTNKMQEYNGYIKKLGDICKLTPAEIKEKFKGINLNTKLVELASIIHSFQPGDPDYYKIHAENEIVNALEGTDDTDSDPDHEMKCEEVPPNSISIPPHLLQHSQRLKNQKRGVRAANVDWVDSKNKSSNESTNITKPKKRVHKPKITLKIRRYVKDPVEKCKILRLDNGTSVVENYREPLVRYPHLEPCNEVHIGQGVQDIKSIEEMHKVAQTYIKMVDLTMPLLVKYQIRDRYCRAIRLYKLNEDRDALKALTFNERKAFFRCEHDFKVGNSGDINNVVTFKNKIVLPDKLIFTVIHYLHKSSEHRGRGNLRESIFKLFWFRRMSQWINEYLKRCETCQAVNIHRDNHKFCMLLKPVHRPNYCWQIDLLGPIEPHKDSEYQYLFTAIDVFDGRVVILPQKDTSAIETVWNIIIGIILKYGPPSVIQSDNAGCFTGSMARFVSRIFDYKVTASTSYTPTTQGKVERSHRIMNKIHALHATIEKNIFDNKSSLDWVKLAAFTEANMNRTRNASTGFSSDELRYGFDHSNPLKLNLELKNINEADYIENGKINFGKYFRIIDYARRNKLFSAAQHIKAYDEARKKQFDKNITRPFEYEVNDLVRFIKYNGSPINIYKRTDRMLPAFKITKKYNANTYQISNGLNTFDTHKQHLLPHYAPFSFAYQHYANPYTKICNPQKTISDDANPERAQPNIPRRSDDCLKNFNTEN